MLERQFFIFGASVAYGVGGAQGGWAGLLERHIHEKLYREGGPGEAMEVYNFAKPGAEIRFVAETFGRQLESYGRQCPKTAFVSVGLNNAKAVDSPRNYVSGQAQFAKDYAALLDSLSGRFEAVNILGFHKVDESKTCPKENPLDGSKSYFKNDRIQEFSQILEKICQAYGSVNFVPLDDLGEDWLETCLFRDGLHPNDKGHRLVFERMKEYL